MENGEYTQSPRHVVLRFLSNRKEFYMINEATGQSFRLDAYLCPLPDDVFVIARADITKIYSLRKRAKRSLLERIKRFVDKTPDVEVKPEEGYTPIKLVRQALDEALEKLYEAESFAKSVDQIMRDHPEVFQDVPYNPYGKLFEKVEEEGVIEEAAEEGGDER